MKSDYPISMSNTFVQQADICTVQNKLLSSATPWLVVEQIAYLHMFGNTKHYGIHFDYTISSSEKIPNIRGNNYLTLKLHCTSKFNFSIFMTFWCINIYIYIFYFTQNTLWYTEKKRSRLSKNFISSIYCGLNKTHVLWVHNSKYARHDKCLLHAALYALHWWSVTEGGLHVNLERVQIIDWAKPSGQETRQRAMIRFIMEEVYSRDK